MPRFRVHLESPNLTKNGAPCFRVTELVADDEDAAVAFCRRAEFEQAAFQIHDAAALAVLEQEEADGTLAKNMKARLFAHRQVEPYDIVSVTEIEGR